MITRLEKETFGLFEWPLKTGFKTYKYVQMPASQFSKHSEQNTNKFHAEYWNAYFYYEQNIKIKKRKKMDTYILS